MSLRLMETSVSEGCLSCIIMIGFASTVQGKEALSCSERQNLAYNKATQTSSSCVVQVCSEVAGLAPRRILSRDTCVLRSSKDTGGKTIKAQSGRQ
jgi:hypothetical protein